MIWKAETMNERLQVEQFKSGNNLVTTQSFDLYFITGIQTGSIQNLQYEWNMATGNLTWRKDVNRNLKENFTYDILNRLTSASIEGGATINFGYYANGNIDSTTFAGIYSYESSRPHAVTSVTNPNSLISTVDQVIEYTSYNKVKKITEDIYELKIFYGVDKERRKIEKRDDETLLLERYYAHFNYEKDIDHGTVTERHYIFGGTGLAAIFEKQGANENMYYLHKDHLGSINCISDQNGSLVQELSFDACLPTVALAKVGGRRRNPNNWTYTGLPSSFIFNRGFTGHEHLDEYGLINMNGRLYDSLVGRFLSTDNFIQAPGFAQSYNRYSYCLNNPLAYTDPTGMNFWDWCADVLKTWLVFTNPYGLVDYLNRRCDGESHQEAINNSTLIYSLTIPIDQIFPGLYDNGSDIPEYDPGATWINPDTGEEEFVNSGSEEYDMAEAKYLWEEANSFPDIELDTYTLVASLDYPAMNYGGGIPEYPLNHDNIVGFHYIDAIDMKAGKALGYREFVYFDDRNHNCATPSIIGDLTYSIVYRELFFLDKAIGDYMLSRGIYEPNKLYIRYYTYEEYSYAWFYRSDPDNCMKDRLFFTGMSYIDE